MRETGSRLCTGTDLDVDWLRRETLVFVAFQTSRHPISHKDTPLAALPALSLTCLVNVRFGHRQTLGVFYSLEVQDLLI
jgi:hypothetical protein